MLSLPVHGNLLLILAPFLGFIFGWLLHRGKVTNYNTIINQFRLKDFTVLKIMLSAIVVGGVGILLLTERGFTQYQIRDANMLATIVGAAIFGIGMVIYGYCPGTGIAAVATGSIHALVGVIGMLVGAVVYAVSFPWLKHHILNMWNLGKATLPQLLNIPASLIYGLLIIIASSLFWWLEKHKL